MIETSVSMFHQDWEWQLAETTSARYWDDHLTSLFRNGTEDKTGMAVFVEEVGEIQSDLSDACRKFFEELEEVSTRA